MQTNEAGIPYHQPQKIIWIHIRQKQIWIQHPNTCHNRTQPSALPWACPKQTDKSYMHYLQNRRFSDDPGAPNYRMWSVWHPQTRNVRNPQPTTFPPQSQWGSPVHPNNKCGLAPSWWGIENTVVVTCRALLLLLDSSLKQWLFRSPAVDPQTDAANILLNFSRKTDSAPHGP